jgi:hypothetical protein
MYLRGTIREQMEVMGSDGVRIGRVARVDWPDRVKLTRGDPTAQGADHFICANWIASVDSKIRLNKHSSEVMALWNGN